MVTNRTKPAEEKTPCKTSEKTFYEVLRDTEKPTVKDTSLRIATRHTPKGFNTAVNQIKALTDVSKEHIVRCAILRGMRHFQEFPKPRSFLNMLQKKATEKYETTEENDLYCNPNRTRMIYSETIITKVDNDLKLHVDEDTIKYIGHLTQYLKISSCDIAIFFFCLGIADMKFDISPDAVRNFEEIMKAFIIALIEREHEIEAYYKYKNPELVVKYLTGKLSE